MSRCEQFWKPAQNFAKWSLGLGFLGTETRARIFKQGSRRLGESRILPFATPYIRNDILTYIWTFMSKDCAMISIRLLPIFLCILVLTKCQDNLIFIPLNFSFHLKIFLIRNFPNISVRMRFEPVWSQLIRLRQMRQFCCMNLACIRRYNVPVYLVCTEWYTDV